MDCRIEPVLFMEIEPSQAVSNNIGSHKIKDFRISPPFQVQPPNIEFH